MTLPVVCERHNANKYYLLKMQLCTIEIVSQDTHIMCVGVFLKSLTLNPRRNYLQVTTSAHVHAQCVSQSVTRVYTLLHPRDLPHNKNLIIKKWSTGKPRIALDNSLPGARAPCVIQRPLKSRALRFLLISFRARATTRRPVPQCGKRRAREIASGGAAQIFIRLGAAALFFPLCTWFSRRRRAT